MSALQQPLAIFALVFDGLAATSDDPEEQAHFSNLATSARSSVAQAEQQELQKYIDTLIDVTASLLSEIDGEECRRALMRELDSSLADRGVFAGHLRSANPYDFARDLFASAAQWLPTALMYEGFKACPEDFECVEEIISELRPRTHDG